MNMLSEEPASLEDTLPTSLFFIGKATIKRNHQIPGRESELSQKGRRKCNSNQSSYVCIPYNKTNNASK